MESVTLTAELKDEASAPLNKLSSNVEGSSKAVQKAVKGQGDAVSKAAAMIGDASSGVGKDLDAMSDAAEKSEGKFSRAMGALSGSVKEAGAAAGEKAKKVGADTGDFLKTSLLGGMVGVGAALTAGLMGAIDGANRGSLLQAQLGLTPEQAQKAGVVTGNLFKAGLGDSMETVQESVSAVAAGLVDINDTASLERVTKKVMNLGDAFGVGPEELSASVGTLISSGLVKGADEGIDLFAGTMQKVPAAMRAELLPVMDEYSKHFAALGFNGADAMGIVALSAEDGAISMDKIGDGLKELTIRATDGSKASSDALEAIGLNGEEIAKRIAGGGEGAKSAFSEIVNGLGSIEDPAAKAQQAIALFGAPLEDLGTDKIQDFLNQVDPMGDAMDDMAGTADKMGEALNSGPAVSIERFKRTVTSSFQELAANALPIIEPVFGFLEKYAPVLAPIALGLGVIAGAIWVMTAAQAAFNAVANMNPVSLIIIAILAGIALLVAGFMYAYNNIGWFKDAVDATFNFIQTVIGNLISFWNTDLLPALMAVGGWFSDVWGGILDFLGPIFDKIGVYVSAMVVIWRDVLIPVIQNVVSWFGEKLGGAISGVGGFIDGAISNFQKFVNFIADKVQPVFDAIGKAKDLVGGFFGGIGDKLGFSGGGVVQAAGGAVLGGYSPGVDSVPAMLSPGEAVLVPELTRAIGARNIMALNRKYSNGRPAGSGPVAEFSGGGILGGGSQTRYEISLVVQVGNGSQPGDVYEEVKRAIREITDEDNRRGY